MVPQHETDVTHLFEGCQVDAKGDEYLVAISDTTVFVVGPPAEGYRMSYLKPDFRLIVPDGDAYWIVYYDVKSDRLFMAEALKFKGNPKNQWHCFVVSKWEEVLRLAGWKERTRNRKGVLV